MTDKPRSRINVGMVLMGIGLGTIAALLILIGFWAPGDPIDRQIVTRAGGTNQRQPSVL